MKLDQIESGEALPRWTALSTVYFLDAVALLGGPALAARLLNLSQTSFVQLINGSAVAGRELAENIDLLTGGKISKHILRPDLFSTAPKYDPLGLIAAGLGKGNPQKPTQKVDPLIAQTEAFEALQRAFKLACDQPGMRNFRACAAAFDEFERLLQL